VKESFLAAAVALNYLEAMQSLIPTAVGQVSMSQSKVTRLSY
jgi:hypothetical protein